MAIESDILQNLSQKVDAQGTIYVAYSGGLDSSVLLHILANSEFKPGLRATHVHHGLSDQADAWAQHCARFCEQLCIPLVVDRVHVEEGGQGIEAAARDRRLEVFSRLLGTHDVVVTAHHQSDQAETFLYRALRGAGLTGLSAMKPSRALGAGQLLRPMLSVSRDELQAYAEGHGIRWVEDESNSETRFDRNYIRAHVVPALSQRWCDAEKRLASTIDNIQSSKAMLDSYLDKDLSALGIRTEVVGESISLAGFKAASGTAQCALLRRWCERLGYYAPDKKQFQELTKLVDAKEDAQPCVQWGSVQFRRFKARLYLLPDLGPAPSADASWHGLDTFELGKVLRLVLVEKNVAERTLPLSGFVLKFDKAGLRCKPVDRAHSQTIKKLFQEYSVPPWLRPFVPLVYVGDSLIAVGGCWACSSDQGSYDFVIEQQNLPT